MLLYAFEVVIASFSLGFKGCWRSPWYLFDVSQLIVGVIAISWSGSGVSFLKSLHLLRAVRIFKVFRLAKGARLLLSSIHTSIPQVLAICKLILLLLVVYSLLGMTIFASSSCSVWTCTVLIVLSSTQVASECVFLTDRLNFKTFGSSIFLLFVLSTGDNFHSAMIDLQRASPSCDTSTTCSENCCSNRWVVFFFFSTFLIVIQYVLLNIVVVCLVVLWCIFILIFRPSSRAI
jgi:hypothetical protein